MNERIKELMSQAGFDPDAIQRMGVMPQAEKFAELIVRECAAISEQHNRNYYTSHGQIIANKIKDHFGVE